MTTFFKVPELTSEDKRLLRTHLDSDQKIRIKIQKNNGIYTMILGKGKLAKRYEVSIESKLKKKSKKSTN